MTTATTSVPIHPLLAERWSPRAFTDDPVTRAELDAILEAARWTMSCYNDQPWTFVVASKDDREAFERLAGLLVEANRTWASKAAALFVVCARTAFAHNGKPNAHARYDTGAAMAMATVQAQALGVHVHQMAGFDAEAAKDVLGLPEGVEAVTAVALGRVGSPEDLPEPLASRERAPRERKPLADVAHHGGRW